MAVLLFPFARGSSAKSIYSLAQILSISSFGKAWKPAPTGTSGWPTCCSCSLICLASPASLGLALLTVPGVLHSQHPLQTFVSLWLPIPPLLVVFMQVMILSVYDCLTLLALSPSSPAHALSHCPLVPLLSFTRIVTAFFP